MKRTNKKTKLVVIIAFIVCITTIPLQNFRKINDLNIGNFKQQINEVPPFIDEMAIESSSCSNQENIEAIFERKLNDYASFGYFPQIYQPSLQATYYAIFILDALGHLELIDETEIINYIIAHYDVDSHIFLDDYARRYLDIDFSMSYFPLTSLLEVNCYAILTLNILGHLDLIDRQESIGFIWSCFNPESEPNGFIGQPYSPDLEERFRLSTLDNNYFAIKTLDVLMDNWDGYTQEKSKIIQFINDLQLISTTTDFYGGFLNDNDFCFDSLGSLMMEPNLLSSYYALKTLEVFNLEDTIRIDHFHHFLNFLYNSTEHTFKVRPYDIDEFNIIGAAVGLDLSDLTEFTNMSRNDVIDFILNNRNELGNWDRSTSQNYHELIDNFQIIRSLNDSGVLSLLSEQERNEIASSILRYKAYQGFSLVSNDYMSLELIHTIVKSFHLYDRISDLDILQLYNTIERCYFYYDFAGYHEFHGSTNTYQYGVVFRTYPIEYYCCGKNNSLEERNYFVGHKHGYFALDSLIKMYKLDDFGVKYSLMDLVNEIIASQFLYSGYDCYGAFLPSIGYDYDKPELEWKFIYLEHSYYAIKTLELLADFLNLGSVNELAFDRAALYDYLKVNYFENDSLIYFKPNYSSKVEDTLESTYYMIYILEAIDYYDLNNQKIRNFLLQNIDYSNLKNIYYQFKISQFLDLQIDLNYNLTSTLIENLYLQDLNEYFLDLNSNKLCQTAFYWVAEMAKVDELKIDCSFNNEVFLGSISSMNTTFCNIAFNEFDENTLVVFDSEQLGRITFERTSNTVYQAMFKVPESPECYPEVEGILKIYDSNKLLGELPISFDTFFKLHINQKLIENSDELFYKVNVSYEFTSGFNPARDSEIFAKVYKNDICVESLKLDKEDFFDYSTFSISYNPKDDTEYKIKFMLIDGYHPDEEMIYEYIINPQESDSLNTPNFAQPIVNAIIICAICGGSVFVTYKGFKWLVGRRRRKKPQKVEVTIKNNKDLSDVVGEILMEDDD